MINIIPMSGKGTRFANEGYLLPKPLITVSGKPMITQVIRTLPPADKWMFTILAEHLRDFALEKIIRAEIPAAQIISLSKTGAETVYGQATDCMAAIKDLPDDEEIFIAACDNSFVYDENKFNELRARPDVDAIIWTFTNDQALTDSPKSWGWTKLASDNETITDMSVKVPVSDNPLNDHAVIASFYFKRAGDFKQAYNLMLQKEHRINNEFYVDAMPIFLSQLGKKSIIFDVDLYIGWGKPSDLHRYELYEYQYKTETLTNPQKTFWQKFFRAIL